MTKSKKSRGLTAAEEAELDTLKAPLRAPTDGEVAAIRLAAQAQKQRPARPSVKLVKQADGVITISNPHEDHAGWQSQLAEAVGTSSTEAANQSLARVWGAVASRNTPITQVQANSALAILAAIAPRDEFEAAIGEQIIAAHFASLDFMSRARLNAGEYVDTAASYAGMATKLSRTMATQIEALTKLRSGGKQQVIVKHVYVNGDAYVGDHGQAAFGRQSAGGGHDLNRHQPDALGPEVWGENPPGDPLQIPRDQRSPPMPDAWRQEPRRTQGGGEREVQARPVHAGNAGGPPASSRNPSAAS